MLIGSHLYNKGVSFYNYLFHPQKTNAVEDDTLNAPSPSRIRLMLSYVTGKVCYGTIVVAKKLYLDVAMHKLKDSFCSLKDSIIAKYQSKPPVVPIISSLPQERPKPVGKRTVSVLDPDWQKKVKEEIIIKTQLRLDLCSISETKLNKDAMIGEFLNAIYCFMDLKLDKDNKLVCNFNINRLKDLIVDQTLSGADIQRMILKVDENISAIKKDKDSAYNGCFRWCMVSCWLNIIYQKQLDKKNGVAETECNAKIEQCMKMIENIQKNPLEEYQHIEKQYKDKVSQLGFRDDPFKMTNSNTSEKTSSTTDKSIEDKLDTIEVDDNYGTTRQVN